MKALTYTITTIFACLCIGCYAQTNATNSKSGQSATKILLYGLVRDKQNKEPIENTQVLIYITDTANIWYGHKRVAKVDGTGKFKVDITSLRDSIKTLVIRCKYISYAFTHIFVQGKVKKSFQIDVDLLYGNGDYKAYYRINPKTSKLKLIKENVNIQTPGF